MSYYPANRLSDRGSSSFRDQNPAAEGNYIPGGANIHQFPRSSPGNHQSRRQDSAAAPAAAAASAAAHHVFRYSQQQEQRPLRIPARQSTTDNRGGAHESSRGFFGQWSFRPWRGSPDVSHESMSRGGGRPRENSRPGSGSSSAFWVFFMVGCIALAILKNIIS